MGYSKHLGGTLIAALFKISFVKRLVSYRVSNCHVQLILSIIE